MPIYNYSCGLGHTRTELRPVEDRDTPVPCYPCRSEMKRVLTFSAVQFKGTGFYRTDKDA